MFYTSDIKHAKRVSAPHQHSPETVSETVIIHPQTGQRDVTIGEAKESIESKPIADQTDLRRIGILISKTLSDWEHAPEQPVVCIHSLSDMIEAVDDDQLVFQFLHILHNCVTSYDARAHYHLDPNRHTEATVQTFRSLFDLTLWYDEDGTVSLSPVQH
ncbi:hypothetical protein GCM10009647_079900 [Streptomyces sanglieri]